MNKSELLGILKSFLPLCEEEEEYGGLINLRTGEIQGPYKGNEDNFPFILPDGSGLRHPDWVGFHTHSKGPADPKPSKEDVYSAHLLGSPEYVITTSGIYEVKPIKVFPVDELRRRWTEVKHLSKELDETPEDAKEAFLSYCWQRLLQDLLPAEVTLLEDPLAEPSSDRVVTASSQEQTH